MLIGFGEAIPFKKMGFVDFAGGTLNVSDKAAIITNTAVASIVAMMVWTVIAYMMVIIFHLLNL